ncbi:hypothetical protein [Wenyingzhuangia sp. IMCC45467]
MKKFFAKIRKKKMLSFDEQGVSMSISNGEKVVVKWANINKVVLLDTFEEYSGYFLTDDYLSKSIYNDICIECSQNIVKIRTGGSPTVKKNTSDPFSRNFGTTSIYYPVFIEYIDEFGNKNLFATHYNNGKKDEVVKQFEAFLPKDKIRQKKKIEGFTPLSEY